MSTSDLERAMGRVRKMMALANDSAASEGERENALRMAHATLAKHNMTMANAELMGERLEEKRDKKQSDVRGAKWALAVAYAVARLFFCEMIYHRRESTVSRAKVSYVGRVGNIITAQEMVNYVVNSIEREGWAIARAEGHPSAWVRAFQVAAMETICRRCRELREAAEKESAATSSGGTALVLASYYDNESKANRQMLVADGVVFKTARPMSLGNSADARERGRDFGGKVSLNKQVGASSGNRRLT